MTDTSASLATAPAGLIEAVADRYRIELFGTAEQLEGGHENDLLLVHDGSRRYVIRVEAGPENRPGWRGSTRS